MAKHEVKFSILENPALNREKIAIEPLEKGYGHTIGQSLRRVMLGYLYGAAVTRVKINNVPHEFSPLKGASEDAVQLIQNIKSINFKMGQPKVHIVTANISREGTVTAGDLKCPAGLEVIDPQQYIATLSDKKSKLELELTVEYGYGYKLVEENEKKPAGTILVDANYSPVRLVSYEVEGTRVGRETDLDRLVMDITTDGSISPKEAIQQAAAILEEKFNLLAGDEIKVYHADDEEEEEQEARPMTMSQPKVYLEELNLPTRVLNTLKNAGYEVVDDLKGVSEEDIRKIKNIGPKTIDLLIKKVKEFE